MRAASDVAGWRSRVPITEAVLRRGGAEAVQQPLESGWVVQGPFVAGSSSSASRPTSARRTPRRRLVHDRAAPRRRGARARPRRRGHRPGVHLGLDRERRRVPRARRRSSATSTSRRSTSTSAAVESLIDRADGRDYSRAPVRARAPTWTPSPRPRRRARPLGRRGRRLRLRGWQRRPPRRHVRRRSAPSAFTRASRSPPARAAWSPRPMRAWTTRPFAARPRRLPHRSRPAHVGRRFLLAEYPHLGFNYR